MSSTMDQKDWQLLFMKKHISKWCRFLDYALEKTLRRCNCFSERSIIETLCVGRSNRCTQQ